MATAIAGGVAGWTLDDFKAHWTDKRGSVGRLRHASLAGLVFRNVGDHGVRRQVDDLHGLTLLTIVRFLEQ